MEDDLKNLKYVYVPINPFNKELCGVKCPQLVVSNMGRTYQCRLFSEELGGKIGLELDFKKGTLRHEKCIAIENKNNSKTNHPCDGCELEDDCVMSCEKYRRYYNKRKK